MTTKPPRVHDLKIKRKFFNDLLSGNKTFEIRYDDRSFEVGDILDLNEVITVDDGEVTKYTGRRTNAKIIYIHRDEPGAAQPFLQPGYVCMSVEVLWEARSQERS